LHPVQAVAEALEIAKGLGAEDVLVEFAGDGPVESLKFHLRDGFAGRARRSGGKGEKG
jgi:hypothetical protein